jgi:hypothetical protein
LLGLCEFVDLCTLQLRKSSLCLPEEWSLCDAPAFVFGLGQSVEQTGGAEEFVTEHNRLGFRA